MSRADDAALEPPRTRGRARPALLVGAALALGGLVAAGLLAPDRGTSEDAPAATPSRSAAPAIIDVHVHVSPQGVPRLLSLMQKRGVSQIVNLSGGNPLAGLDEQLQAAAKTQGKVI